MLVEMPQSSDWGFFFLFSLDRMSGIEYKAKIILSSKNITWI
jgi:hypothetical protein